MSPRSRPTHTSEEEEHPFINGRDVDAAVDESIVIEATRDEILNLVPSEVGPVECTKQPTTADVNRTAHEFLGDAYVRKGDFVSARKAYVTARAAHKVSAIDAAMERSTEHKPSLSSEAAHAQPLAKVSKGDRSAWLAKAEAELSRGRHEMAISALRKAEAWERLIELGDALLERDDANMRRLAFRAYRLAGAFDRINANAERYPGGAIRAYMATGARDALRVYVEAVMNGPEWKLRSMGLLFDLYKAYRYLGGPRERFLQIGDYFVAIDHPLALTAFRAAAKLKLEAERGQVPS